MRDFVARFPAGRVIAQRMSDSLVQLLDDCMSLEPGRRPTTAAQLLGYAWFTDPPPAAPPALAAEDSGGGAHYRGLSAGDDSPQWRGSAGPQYRSLGADEEPGLDELPPPPMPTRQVAFRGEHWE